MIFSELYSAYYNAIAAIIARVIDGEPTEKELAAIVSRYAFGESVLTVMPALKAGRWQLLYPDLTTPISHKPTMPLTALQKQWLKAISQDPRIKLFDVTQTGLEDVEPLFTAQDYLVYDRYGDGDPYEDAEYIRQFRTVLEAIRRGTQIKFEMTNRNGKTMFVRCRPLRLEYSEKDDKFRVVTAGWRSVSTVNLARMRACEHYTGERRADGDPIVSEQETLILKVRDERNALERVMLHFAHFEKQAERQDADVYLLRIKCARDDLSELVIRILSFGPMVEVVGSKECRRLIVEKLKKQKSCELK